MSKKTKQFTTYQEVGSYVNGFKRYFTPVFPTDPEIVCKQIKSYLKGNDLDFISELLSSDFVYRNALKKQVWINSHPKETDQLKEQHELYCVRPFLEALFYERQSLFFRLISDVIESENIAIYEIFIKHLEQTDIPKTALSPWKDTTFKNVKKSIIDIEEYGKKIKAISDKGFDAMSLSRNLSQLVKNPPERKENNINKSKIEWLHFKLKFMNELHQYDAKFAPHRGWKKIVANFASFIFSGCLFNAFNYCLTRNWWFCNQTTTEGKINRLHKLVNSDNGMGYSVKR